MELGTCLTTKIEPLLSWLITKINEVLTSRERFVPKSWLRLCCWKVEPSLSLTRMNHNKSNGLANRRLRESRQQLTLKQNENVAMRWWLTIALEINSERDDSKADAEHPLDLVLKLLKILLKLPTMAMKPRIVDNYAGHLIQKEKKSLDLAHMDVVPAGSMGRQIHRQPEITWLCLCAWSVWW